MGSIPIRVARGVMWPTFCPESPGIEIEIVEEPREARIGYTNPRQTSVCRASGPPTLRFPQESKPAPQKHYTVSQLRKKRDSLLRQIARQEAKEAEKRELLENCQSLAAELEAMKTKTYSI